MKLMKIALIGPGIMPIPPKGWGAVEILLWDYYQELSKVGHDVVIINTPRLYEIVEIVNSGGFDFVHLHYDCFYTVLDQLTCPCIAITSHYPYIDQPSKHVADGYHRICDFLVKQTKYYHFVLAEKDMQALLQYGANPRYLRKIKNGIDSSLFQFREHAITSQTLYLGKITPRKNQAKLQSIPTIDFVGGCDDPEFDTKRKNYLGEWTREYLHEHMTDYVNLVLLSQGEADPLVVKEALIAGLGVVVNRSSAENLDLAKDFITVIPDEQMMDPQFVYFIIQQNKRVAMDRRNEIREYGISQFDIAKEVKQYLDILGEIV